MRFDTYARPDDGSMNFMIANVIRSAATGDIVVIASWDTCSVNHDFRDALTNFCGASTFSNTWESGKDVVEVLRRSHVFVGRRISEAEEREIAAEVSSCCVQSAASHALFLLSAFPIAEGCC
jgi:hypothetical protein